MLARSFYRIFAIIVFTIVSIASALAENNVLFVFDASNSMWGKVEGVAKIETARKSFHEMLSGLKEDVNIGVIAYGHNQKKSCEDVQTLAPIGSEISLISKKVNEIVPKGKTPIAAALKAGAESFPEGDNINSIILISDGKETCHADPCSVAAELVSRGINLKIHVVGFDISEEERTQLQCIAHAGKGRFFDATTAKELQKAVNSVSKEVTSAGKTVLTEVFRDDFEGREVQKHWMIQNANSETFVVEDGALLGISGFPDNENKGNAWFENIFSLQTGLPKGNWTATVKLKIEFSTGYDTFTLALYKDGDNWLGSQIYSYHDNRGSKLMLTAVKKAKGKITANSGLFVEEDKSFPAIQARAVQPLYLRLEKSGRSYTTSAKLDDMDDWIVIDKISSLRAPDTLGFSASQHDQGWGINKSGETVWKMDWIRIEAPFLQNQ
ncbi:MAG: VWA domain-containing protein [Sneathiellales bacterium]|nr:VWA domain-containing protein [Sneathiellales bacterium]